ncbi:hypothetical protein VTJ04DRAFT_9570 [Mycothermus thermophilus]|uniref:uncharacterized protein n=1 Tax=Humicola insolens TaxID=85995 RepID=UPI0037434377
MPITLSLTAESNEGPQSPRFEYFLALPPELRVMVYNLVLHRPQSIIWPTNGVVENFLDLGLFCVNRLVSTEARRQFYAINTFKFERREYNQTSSAELMVKWYA